MQEVKLNKVILKLAQLVGIDVSIEFRSVPERVVSGVLTAFDLDHDMLIIDKGLKEEGEKLVVINWQDVSIMREIR